MVKRCKTLNTVSVTFYLRCYFTWIYITSYWMPSVQVAWSTGTSDYPLTIYLAQL